MEYVFCGEDSDDPHSNHQRIFKNKFDEELEYFGFSSAGFPSTSQLKMISKIALQYEMAATKAKAWLFHLRSSLDRQADHHPKSVQKEHCFLDGLVAAATKANHFFFR